MARGVRGTRGNPPLGAPCVHDKPSVRDTRVIRGWVGEQARPYAARPVPRSVTATGQPVPKFTATAAVSGRTVSDADLKGTGVLVVHGAKTADAAKEVSKAVRTRWPQPQQVFLASIVDLRAFSGLWKRVAEAQVK